MSADLVIFDLHFCEAFEECRKGSAGKRRSGPAFASDSRVRKPLKEQAMPATAHLSYWHETTGELTSHFPTLETDMHVDIAILGGGITGLTAAAHLQQLGRRVVVLEAGQIGSGTTGFTSGHLDATTDFDLNKMIFEY